MSVLYQKALLLSAVEATFRTDEIALLTLATAKANNAMLVVDPQFTADVTALQRNNVKTHLSPDPGIVARKIASVTFQHEVRSNGELDGTPPPRLGFLLRGCGMQELAVPADTTGAGGSPNGHFVGFGATFNELVPCKIAATSPIRPTVTVTGTYAGTLPRTFVMECTTGGSETASVWKFRHRTQGSNASVEDTGNAGSAIGPMDGLTMALSAGTYAIGDKYAGTIYPQGTLYQPLSTAFESNTHYLYYGLFEDATNSLKHVLTGSRGTFRVEGQAGNYALFTFTFTGDYVNPADSTDDIETDVTYETTLPRQVELANMIASGGPGVADYLNDFSLCAQGFQIDMGNEVVARECINGQESYEGAIITSRNPTAGFNPETTLEAEHPFWGNMGTGDRVFFNVGVGNAAGNIVSFTSPYSQYVNLAYANRNNLRAYDVNLRLATHGSSGNDELRIFFG